MVEAVEAQSIVDASAEPEVQRLEQRALAAEQALEEVRATLAQRQQQLDAHAQSIARLERRRSLEAALRSAGVVDLEAACVACEAHLDAATGSDADAAVAELRRSKPFLFRTAVQRSRARAMSPAYTASHATRQTVDRAAADAGQSGKRADLLRYLRLRRTP